MASAESFAKAGIAGVGVFVASVVFLHVVQPELDPVDMAVSYYMNGPFGWVLGLGLVSLGVGSLSLAAGLRHRLRQTGTGVGIWLLVLWGLGAVVGGIFPPDPPGHWNEPASFPGMIHGVAAMVAFVAFSPAAWLLSRRIAFRPRTLAVGRLGEFLAMLCTVFLLAFFVCLAPVFTNRAPYAIGLVERVLLVLYAGWLVTTGVIVGPAWTLDITSQDTL